MTCHEMRSELLTGSLDFDHPHLEQCPDCRAIAEVIRAGVRDLDFGLDDLGTAVPYSVARARLPTDTFRRRFDMFGLHSFAIAIAAAAALALGLPVLLPSGGVPSTAPIASPARPDPAHLEAARDLAIETKQIEWNLLSERDWGLRADALWEAFQHIDPYVPSDDPEIDDVAFLVLSEVGRAAENRNAPTPPLFAKLGSGKTVNLGWWLAATLATPERVASLSKDTALSIRHHVDMQAKEADCELPANRVPLVVGLTKISQRQLAGTRVDLLVDGDVIAEDLRIYCIEGGKLSLEATTETAPALQRSVHAGSVVDVRRH